MSDPKLEAKAKEWLDRYERDEFHLDLVSLTALLEEVQKEGAMSDAVETLKRFLKTGLATDAWTVRDAIRALLEANERLEATIDKADEHTKGLMEEVQRLKRDVQFQYEGTASLRADYQEALRMKERLLEDNDRAAKEVERLERREEIQNGMCDRREADTTRRRAGSGWSGF